MHRSLRLPPVVLHTFLIGMIAFVAIGSATAQEQGPPPGGARRQVLLPLGNAQYVKLSSGKRIAKIDSDIPGVVTWTFARKTDPKTGQDVADPTTLIITGQVAGVTTLTLTDEGGLTETLRVIVQTDTEHLRFLLSQAVPTANVNVIPTANNVMILTGHVQRSEDVPIVLETARSVVGDRIVNAMRVGGVMQVQLCVTVARVARSEARSMGFSFSETGNQHYLASILSAPTNLAISNLASPSAVASSLAGSPNAIFGIVGPNQGFQGFLTALRTENLVKVLAEPKLITLSGQPAEFISGGEQAVPTLASGSDGGGAVAGVEFRPFGTTVRFLPIVLGNGKIYLEVEPQFTFPAPSNLFSAPIPGTNSVVFGRTTQRVRTSVVMEDGQTFAIGGMVFHSVNGNAVRVPILGDLPFIGAAFSQMSYSESEEELLVLVTPRLVDALACDQVPKCLPGQETRSPSDFELFLERILEAPRGPRQVVQNRHYVPAYRNSDTYGRFPSAGACCQGGDGHCVHGRCDDMRAGSPCANCGYGGQGGCTTCGTAGHGPSQPNLLQVPEAPVPVQGLAAPQATAPANLPSAAPLPQTSSATLPETLGAAPMPAPSAGGEQR